MMISTKGRYALRIMIDLAQHLDDGFIPMTVIAERQKASVKYLEAIVAGLYRAGLVESRRGKEGGYRLAKEPGDCKVYDIISTAEGSIAPIACLREDEKPCDRSADCLTLPMWRKLDGVIEEYLSSVSLANILDKTI